MKLSVIIPCLNAEKTIEVQLEALSRQQWHGGWEVVVADNGSTDATREVVARFYGRLPDLRVVDASARRGAAHARNRAVQASLGDALAFCDADDEVGTGWLMAIGNALTRHDFVASRMDVEKLNSLSLAATLNNVQGRELRRAYYPPYLFHAGSSGMAVKRAVHEMVGGFDESLREREDTDYCFRIQLQGVMLHFAPDATIHIRYSNKSHALFRQARQWARYQALLYKRYGRSLPLEKPWGSYLQTWRDLLGCMPRLLNPAKRPAWMKTLGTQVGLLEGVIRYRVAPVCAPHRAESAVDAAAATIVAIEPHSMESRAQGSRRMIGAQKKPAASPADAGTVRQMLTFLVTTGSEVSAVFM